MTDRLELQVQKNTPRGTKHAEHAGHTNHVAHSAASGEMQAMRRTIQDQAQQIADLKHALGAKSDERAKAMAEAQAMTHIGSWRWDIINDVIMWSDELYRMHGLKPQPSAIDYGKYLKSIHPEDRGIAQAVIQRSMQTGQPFEFEHRIILPNKKVRTILGMGKVITSKGRAVRMIGTSQDITKQKETQLALQRSDERFRSVSEATHDLVYDIDLLSDSIWFNEVLGTDYGYPRKALGKSLAWWTSRIHHEDRERVRAEIRELLSSNRQSWHTEHRFRKADGSFAVVRNRASILRNTSGEPERMIGSFLDITEAKKLDRAKDEFITLVSHQLRTPLTIIRLYGNMLTDGVAGQLTSDQQSYVDKMSHASVRLIKLVGDILNISRLELNRIKIESSPTDPNLLIHASIDELGPVAKAKSAIISFRANPKLGMIPIDATVFGEIVRNLIGNALRYVEPDKGQVDISFRKDRRGYLLTVKDNGIGIPANAQPHIYERFYRAKNAVNADGEGTGLGLYLVKLFVDTAGGKTWFDSSEKLGTTFYVAFPPEGMQGQSTDTEAQS